MDSRQPRRKDARRSIDTFFPDQQEQESNEFSFRLEDELTPERVEEIVGDFTELLKELDSGQRGLGIPRDIAACFGSFPILQERTRSLFTPKTFDIFMEESVSRVNDERFIGSENTALLRALYTFYPQRASEFQEKNFLSKRKSEIQKYAGKKWSTNLLYDECANFLLLFPERRNELPINAETFQQVNELIQGSRERALQVGNRQGAMNFFETAAHVVLLHPDRKGDLGIDAKISDLGKGFLTEFGSQGGVGYRSYLQFLEKMSILAAREVRIPSPGRLEFVFDEKPSRISTASPMPLPNEFS